MYILTYWGCRSVVGLRSPKPPTGVRLSPPLPIITSKIALLVFHKCTLEFEIEYAL